MSKETYTSWDSAEFLGDDEVVVEYLRAALEENDPAFFVKAVGNVARAKGMSQVAQEAQLGRQNLYRSLSGEHDPQIGTLMKVLDSLGVQLTVAPSRREDVKKKEIHLMSFRDANGDPEALHRWKIRLLKELARLTGLNIKFDRVLRDKCLYRLDKIAEKVHITISDWNPDSERNPGQHLWVELWPAGTAAQADCFYEAVNRGSNRKAFLVLNKQGWVIRPNSGFHFAQTSLFESGTSLDAPGHLEYFFAGARPYGRYYFPGNGGNAQRELTLPLIERWQRDGVISPEARRNIENQRDNTRHQSIDLKPGFWVYRTWEPDEVIKLEEQGKLEAHIMQALAIPLATWGETLL